MKSMEYYDRILTKAKVLKHPKSYSLNYLRSHGTNKLGTATITSHYSAGWLNGKTDTLTHKINAQGKVIQSDHPNFIKEEIDSQGMQIPPQHTHIRRNKKHTRPAKKATMARVAEDILTEAVAKTLASTMQRGRSTSGGMSKPSGSSAVVNNIKQRMGNLKLQQASLKRQAIQAKISSMQQKARQASAKLTQK